MNYENLVGTTVFHSSGPLVVKRIRDTGGVPTMVCYSDDCRVTVIVPLAKFGTVVRQAGAPDDAVAARKAMRDLRPIIPPTYKKRREYLESMIQVNTMESVAVAFAMLVRLSREKDLSYGERQLEQKLRLRLETEAKLILGDAGSEWIAESIKEARI